MGMGTSSPSVPGCTSFSSPKVGQESDIKIQERAGQDPSYFFPEKSTNCKC